MIVTLPKPGDEGYDKAQRIVRYRPRGLTVQVAYHAPIAHLLGTPCVYFNPRPRWSRYPLVHERNVVPILVHESVHCALQRLIGLSDLVHDDSLHEVQQGIDRIFPEVGDL